MNWTPFSLGRTGRAQVAVTVDSPVASGAPYMSEAGNEGRVGNGHRARASQSRLSAVCLHIPARRRARAKRARTSMAAMFILTFLDEVPSMVVDGRSEVVMVVMV